MVENIIPPQITGIPETGDASVLSTIGNAVSQGVQSALPAQGTETPMTQAGEPSLMGIFGDTLKRAGMIALVGAIIGAAIAIGTTFFNATPETVLGFLKNIGIGTFSSGTPGLLLTGAINGALGGALVGVPVASYSGMHKMRSYYHDVALLKAHDTGIAEGMQLGAQLEHDISTQSPQSGKYQDIVTQRAASFAQQAINDAKAAETSRGISA